MHHTYMLIVKVWFTRPYIKANTFFKKFPSNDCQTCDGIFYLATLEPVEENLLLHCALLQCHLLHHISGRYGRHILVNLKYIFPVLSKRAGS